MATEYLNIMQNYVWIHFIVIVWSFFEAWLPIHFHVTENRHQEMQNISSCVKKKKKRKPTVHYHLKVWGHFFLKKLILSFNKVALNDQTLQ